MKGLVGGAGRLIETKYRIDLPASPLLHRIKQYVSQNNTGIYSQIIRNKRDCQATLAPPNAQKHLRSCEKCANVKTVSKITARLKYNIK